MRSDRDGGFVTFFCRCKQRFRRVASVGLPGANPFKTQHRGRAPALPTSSLPMNSALRHGFAATLAAGLLATSLSAQSNTFPATGNVGIGTTAPAAKLDITDSSTAALRVGVANNAANSVVQVRESLSVVGRSTAATSFLGAVASDYYNNGSGATFRGTLLAYTGPLVGGTPWGIPEANSGKLIFQNCSNALIGTNGPTPIFIAPYGLPAVVVRPGGAVGIGTTNPTHKLEVAGTIRAQEVIVETSGWSDYVFAPGYQLTPLAEVKAHIAAKGTLPGIPSAAEVATQGVSVGDMQAKLLAKLEEMTLHLIALSEKVERLETENAALKTKLNP